MSSSILSDPISHSHTRTLAHRARPSCPVASCATESPVSNTSDTAGATRSPLLARRHSTPPDIPSLPAGMIPAHLLQQQSADYARLPSAEDVRTYAPPPSSYSALFVSSPSNSHSAPTLPSSQLSRTDSRSADPRSRSLVSLVEPMTRAAQNLVKSSVPEALMAHFPDSSSEDGVEGLAAQFPHPPEQRLPQLTGGGFAAAAFAGSTPKQPGDRRSASSQQSKKSEQSRQSGQSGKSLPPPIKTERRISNNSVRSAASATPSSPTIPATPVPSSPVSSASSASSPTLTHNSTDTGLFYSPDRRSTGHYVSYPKPPPPFGYEDKARASLPPTPSGPRGARSARNSLQTAPPIRPPPPHAPSAPDLRTPDLGDCAELKSPLEDIDPRDFQDPPEPPAAYARAERRQTVDFTQRERSESRASRATTLTSGSSEVRGPLRASAAAHARVYRRQAANASRVVTSPADEPLDYKPSRRKRLGDHNRVARWLHNAVSRPFGLETIDD